VTAELSPLSRPLDPSAAALRRSPLADRAADLQRACGPAVALAEIPFLSQVNLRVGPGSAAALRIGAAVGVRLPTAGRAATVDRDGGPGRGRDGVERAALWLGPDEWLLIGPDGDAPELVGLATAALHGDPGSVVDVSADRTTLQLSGPAAREVLAKGMTIDLHPRAFGPGSAAATTLARTRVLLWQIEGERGGEISEPGAPAYRLLVRGSFAGYLADWLIDAAAEFRVPAEVAEGAG
jgi:sarcosine oxidase subunit gamma